LTADDQRDVPDEYQRLKGTERNRLPGAERATSANPEDEVTVTILVCRRPDDPSMPDHDDLLELLWLGASRFLARSSASAMAATMPRKKGFNEPRYWYLQLSARPNKPVEKADPAITHILTGGAVTHVCALVSGWFSSF
jgi:hypothetical protein